MRGITKRFGGLTANDRVDLSVATGEIHCLLGENGAGKSTLVKILFGLYPKDSGEILLDGMPVDIASPAHAIRLGIGMVHQHFMLVDRLTVLENLIAGMEPTRRGLIDFAAARERVRSVAERYGLAVDVDARVEELSVGEQQRVEILKSLLREAKILILDEPTAVLTPREVDDLFHVMQSLRSQGKTLIFITHKLRETMAFSDRVTVLRAGRNAGTVPTAETSPEELAQMMVGRKVILRVERPAANQRTRPVVEQEVARGVMQEAKQGIEPGADHGGEENARHGTEEKAYHRTEQNAKHATDDEPVLLETRGLKVTDRNGRTRLVDINLHVRAGEILGVVGVEGNGQLELEEVITGLRAPSAGSVKICGEELWTGSNPTTPRRFRALGGAHIPSDRLRRGIITSLPLTTATRSWADKERLRSCGENGSAASLRLTQSAGTPPGSSIASTSAPHRWRAPPVRFQAATSKSLSSEESSPLIPR